MSLVVALSGSREAIIGGDCRAITFFGACPGLEEDLYSGKIKSDQDLLARSKDSGATLQVSDGREKVWMHREGVLAGEVTEITPNLERRRRIYLTPGANLMVSITGSDARIESKGKVGCIVLGNRFTQNLAATLVNEAGSRVNEDLIKRILLEAGESTASVSRNHIVLKTHVKKPDPMATLLKAFHEDCVKCGWRLCDQQ